jgi:hypothetical protein
MPNQKKYTLKGQITDYSGRPLPNLRIKAFDLDPNSPDDLLGKEVTTGSKGQYLIEYSEKRFKRPVESRGPDIEVRVYDEEKHYLGKSEFYPNAKQQMIINVSVDPEHVQAGPKDVVAQKYLSLIKLPKNKTKKIIDKGLDLHLANDADLELLVGDKVLTKKQKEELRLTIDLGRLTGQNLPLIEVLKNDQLDSVADFIDWEKEDWVNALKENKIAAPANADSLEDYAEKLRKTVEASYPTHYFLHRTAKKKYESEQKDLKAIQRLFGQEVALIKEKKANLKEIDWRGISASSKKKIEKSLHRLAAFSNTYRYLGIKEVINDRNLEPATKQETIEQRTKALNTFYENNPQLNLKQDDFFSKENGLNWQGLEKGDQKRITSQLMAYQRVMNLTPKYEIQHHLLINGYDSALAIASKPEKQFIAETGMDKFEGKAIYGKARYEASLAILAQESIRSEVRGYQARTNVTNTKGLVNALKGIESYEEIFGEQDFCDCPHCKSIFGPAAYFTDLMHFVENHISKELFIPGGSSKIDRTDHPLYLKNRRPDLWKLPLTCENTNQEIPYLEVVNDVLEQFIEQEEGVTDIYGRLKNTDTAISLPFHLPLEELRLFLAHFDMSLYDVYQTLGIGRADQAREKLRISTEELKIITQKNPSRAAAVFGNESLANFEVQPFIKYAGISREELDDLTAIKTFPEIAKVQISRIKDPSDIQQYKEVLTHLTPTRLELIHRFLRLWKKTSWTIPELDLILEEMGVNKLEEKEAGFHKVLQLGEWQVIQERLELTVEEVATLAGNIPQRPVIKGKESLYSRLFDLESIFNGNASVTLETDRSKDKIRPHLWAGLGIQEPALEALLNFLGGGQVITHQKISDLFKYVLIARGLDLSIEELSHMAKLPWEASPFTAIQNTAHLLHLIQFTDWLFSSPFSVADLLFITTGEESSKKRYDQNLATVTIAVQDIQEKGTDPTEELKKQLKQTFRLSEEQLDSDFLKKLVGVDINDQAIEDALNAKITDGQLDNPSDIDPLIALYRGIERKFYLFEKLQFDGDAIQYFVGEKAVFGIADLNDLPLSAIRYATYFHEFEKGEQSSISKIKEILKEYQPATKKFSNKVVPLIAQLWEQNEEQIQSLLDGVDLSFSSNPLAALQHLKKVHDLLKKLGIDGTSIKKLGSIVYTDIAAARDVALAAFASKYKDENERREKLEPYYDKVNTLKRDALCDYIIAQRQKYLFEDRSDLYQFFLLDVDMSGCFRTSKVVAAISSLQLYVHRCRINLEQSDETLIRQVEPIRVDPGLIPEKEWEWRKNYRVWEANRKVFLYPENYMIPGLRESKSELFKELESELLQENITKESAEAAYKKYWEGFTKLANLKYVGALYNEIYENELFPLDLFGEDGLRYSFGSLRTIPSDESHYYFIARTEKDPHEYYYRTYNEIKNQWGNWQKIELAIQADDVSALMYRGKLHLFWTEVEQKDVTKVKGGDAKSEGTAFKVYVKYAFLNGNNTWSAVQKVYLGQMHFSEDEKKLFYDRLGEAFPTDEKEREKKNEYVIKQFKRTVFRKPYTLKTRNETAPIELAYLWKLGKVDVEKYKTSSFEKTQYVNWYHVPIKYSIPSTEFFVKNATFPVSKSVEVIATGFVEVQYTAKLTLVSPTDCVFEHKGTTFKVPVSPDSNIPNIAATKHQLSLTKNEIVDASVEDVRTLSLPLDNSSGLSFLTKEANLAYLPSSGSVSDFQRHIENSQENFTHRGKIISQDKLGKATFGVPDDGQEILLSTILTDQLGERLETMGLEKFLSSSTQYLTEGSELMEFSGPYGNYYWELFFHIPHLIANHLNANQKFKEAKWWYERIFNPTSTESPSKDWPGDHYWQFKEFRNQTIEKLQDKLRNGQAIAAYHQDPFDPFAIADTRRSAYQKAIVMNYIDNLLDWGDHLFTQDTRESIHEAEMLYQLAKDILGDRPVKVGACETVSESAVTFENIGPRIGKISEFLLSLENRNHRNRVEYKNDIQPFENAKRHNLLLHKVGIPEKKLSLAEANLLASSRGYRDYYKKLDKLKNGALARATNLPAAPKNRKSFQRFNRVRDFFNHGVSAEKSWSFKGEWEKRTEDLNKIREWGGEFKLKSDPHIQPTLQIGTLVFCVPHNDYFLKYWDRVEDRLWKIRYCMNIKGIRRSLALFQPPIDPMLLVRAKAAGLTFDKLFGGTVGTSMYRFTFLVNKARQFTQTVQSFGSALLSALEKKDGEDLKLLRSTHEQNILNLSTKIKTDAADEAKLQYEAIQASQDNIQIKIDYYQKLLNEGLTKNEQAQQFFKHFATSLRTLQIAQEAIAALIYLIAQVGSPLALKYGGKEVGDSTKMWSAYLSSRAKIFNEIAASAGLEASFERRKQQWKHQKNIAIQELKQVEKQKEAAAIRVAIANQNKFVHEQNILQSKELDTFYKDKFTGFELYQHLASVLQRLYREAYQLASSMAMKAQQSYWLETDDDTYYLDVNNWDEENAGLLAGEKLLLQLHQMENAYLEQNTRQPEITQSFSLALLDPEKLVELRQKGTCEFTIPKLAFEVMYPGHYRRVIKSVQLSMPCIVGPYTNVGARLILEDHEVEDENGQKIPNWPKIQATSICTSSSMNDDGMFEFNFRDERYLPFEGAGAVRSKWKLELPANFRSFDYDTISDVILHINYTAKEGNREEAEAKLKQMIIDHAANPGLFRLFSLKHDFSNAYHELMNPPEGATQTVANFITEARHLPYLLRDKTLSITATTIYLKPKDKEAIATFPGSLQLNDATIQGETTLDIPLGNSTENKDKLRAGTVSLNGSPIQEWTFEGSPEDLNTAIIDDILLLIKYQI